MEQELCSVCAKVIDPDSARSGAAVDARTSPSASDAAAKHSTRWPAGGDGAARHRRAVAAGAEHEGVLSLPPTVAGAGRSAGYRLGTMRTRGRCIRYFPPSANRYPAMFELEPFERPLVPRRRRYVVLYCDERGHPDRHATLHHRRPFPRTVPSIYRRGSCSDAATAGGAGRLIAARIFRHALWCAEIASAWKEATGRSAGLRAPPPPGGLGPSTKQAICLAGAHRKGLCGASGPPAGRCPQCKIGTGRGQKQHLGGLCSEPVWAGQAGRVAGGGR